MKKETGIRMTLVGSTEWTSGGHHHRREQWTIEGGEIDPAWRRYAGAGEPFSRFTLYVVDGEIDLRVASYGGAVWPTAWSELFQANRRPGSRAFVEITDLGLMFRDAALDGASGAFDDTRMLP